MKQLKLVLMAHGMKRGLTGDLDRDVWKPKATNKTRKEGLKVTYTDISEGAVEQVR